MDVSSIAAMSVNMHQQMADQQMGVAVLKMAMNADAQMTADMLEAIDVSSLTGVGGNIDILA